MQRYGRGQLQELERSGLFWRCVASGVSGCSWNGGPGLIGDLDICLEAFVVSMVSPDLSIGSC